MKGLLRPQREFFDHELTEEEAKLFVQEKSKQENKFKLAMVTPILDSHEVLRRQILFWSKHVFNDEELRKKCEVVIVDDCSDPPLSTVFDQCKDIINFHYKLINTNTEMPWMQMYGQNIGVKAAESEHCLMCGIDHIMPKEVFEAGVNLQDDKMHFPRKYAVLDENGDLRRESKILYE